MRSGSGGLDGGAGVPPGKCFFVAESIAPEGFISPHPAPDWASLPGAGFGVKLLGEIAWRRPIDAAFQPFSGNGVAIPAGRPRK